MVATLLLAVTVSNTSSGPPGEPVILPPPILMPESETPGTAPALAPGDTRILFVNFDPIAMTRCPSSDSRANCSSIVPGGTVMFPGFTGSAAIKTQAINLVKQYYEPFNIDIVTTRPSSGDYSMIVASG